LTDSDSTKKRKKILWQGNGGVKTPKYGISLWQNFLGAGTAVSGHFVAEFVSNVEAIGSRTEGE
jgi:hypothetical protein